MTYSFKEWTVSGMWKYLWPAIGAITLVLLGALIRHYWGIGGKAAFAIGGLTLLVCVEVYYHVQRRSLLNAIRAMDDAERRVYFNTIESIGCVEDLREIVTPEVSLLGKTVSVILGIFLLFGPPIAYHLISQQPLTVNAPLTGGHILSMLAGAGVYFLLRRKVEARFREQPDELSMTLPVARREENL